MSALRGYDSWLDDEGPEDTQGRIEALEKEVEWLRENLLWLEFSEAVVMLPPGGAKVDVANVCPFCAISGGHDEKCSMFSGLGKIRSKYL